MESVAGLISELQKMIAALRRTPGELASHSPLATSHFQWSLHSTKLNNSRPSKACATFSRRSPRCGTASSRPRAKSSARLVSPKFVLPIFEQTDLFARSVGSETDIVSKEMYSFEDQADP